MMVIEKNYKSTTINMEEEMIKNIKHIALHENRSMSSQIRIMLRKAVREYFDEHSDFNF